VGSKTDFELRQAVTDASGADAWNSVSETLGRLRERGFVEDCLPFPGVTIEDAARFDRLLNFLSAFEGPSRSRADYLVRLRNARVVVVGTGGIGSWLIFSLLCIGVGELRLVDADRVEASNLNRSILYSEADIGRPKVLAAADAARRFAPRTRVVPFDVLVTGPDVLAPLVDGVDVVVGTADTPPTHIRLWVAAAARRAGVPSVQGGGLRVGPFALPDASCAGCDIAHLLDRDPRYRTVVESQRTLPKPPSSALPQVGAITAGVLAFDLLRYLAGYGPPMTVNAVWEMAPDLSATVRPLTPHPRCRVCSSAGQDAGLP
jgi:hypothetical protein